MKSWDVVIIGGGIIGMSLALSLRRHGAQVLVVDRSEPGREATHAAAGMLAYCDPHTPEVLTSLASASIALYPEFIHEIEDESGLRVDYRSEGTILFLSGDEEEPFCDGARRLDPSDLQLLEPKLSTAPAGAVLLPEPSVDPRTLMTAALKAARHRGVDVSSGTTVTQVEITNLGVSGVATSRTRFPAAAVVNCAGAWAGEIAGAAFRIPARPVKGHMLDLVPGPLLTHASAAERPANPHSPHLLTHVVRTEHVYLVPRSDARIVVGSTVEESGFDKRVVPETIQRLHQAAANLLPELGEARIHESWTGLRPGSPDGLPILGSTSVAGYYVATGHFRDGILLAPITAQLMTQLIRGEEPGFDLSPFSPARFQR